MGQLQAQLTIAQKEAKAGSQAVQEQLQGVQQRCRTASGKLACAHTCPQQRQR